MRNKQILGYREENGVFPTSRTETFAAMKFFIDNWRWAGVPFYMRTGKRMNAKHTEIVIVYKDSSHSIFSGKKEDSSNKLVIRLQPNEGIELEMVSKKHSLRERLSTEKRVLNLDFNELNSKIESLEKKLNSLDSFLQNKYEVTQVDQSLDGELSIFHQLDNQSSIKQNKSLLVLESENINYKSKFKLFHFIMTINFLFLILISLIVYLKNIPIKEVLNIF